MLNDLLQRQHLDDERRKGCLQPRLARLAPHVSASYVRSTIHGSATAQLVYIDETGSVGTGGAGQPLLTLVAVLVDDTEVLAPVPDLPALIHGHRADAVGRCSATDPPVERSLDPDTCMTLPRP